MARADKTIAAIFLRLPPAAAVLLFSAAFGLTAGHALPRQTKVVAYRELDVVPFPLPTAGPLSPFDLRLRQDDNTICGYIGGDTALPATCSVGSHCVLDPLYSVVGCCPNGDTCTTGVFTGCVDINSPPQTEINPYIFTCQGSDVCFQNQFAGGFSQFGCGTASSLGTTVQTSVANAISTLSLETSEVSLTETPSTLATPTTIGSTSSAATTTAISSETTSTSSLTSETSTRSSSSEISTSPTSSETSISSTSSKTSTSSTPSETSTGSSSTQSSSSSHSSTTTSSTTQTISKTTTQTAPSSTTPSTSLLPTTSSLPPPTGQTARANQTAAIVGGTIGGAAALSLLSLAFFCWRRRGHNPRRGPGPAPAPPPTTEYISPARSHGAAFAPLPNWNEDDGVYIPYYQGHAPNPYGPLEPDVPAAANLPHHSHGFSQPLRYNSAYMAGAKAGGGSARAGLTPVAEEEHPFEAAAAPSPSHSQAQGREIDDFSRAYASARIGQLPDDDTDEDRAPLRDNIHGGDDSPPDLEESPPRHRGSRPLWQQNRQQSRNLMWL